MITSIQYNISINNIPHKTKIFEFLFLQYTYRLMLYSMSVPNGSLNLSGSVNVWTAWFGGFGHRADLYLLDGILSHWTGKITVESAKISEQCESSLNTDTHKQIHTDFPPSPSAKKKKKHLRHEPLRSWVNRRFERYGFVVNWTDSRGESRLLMFIYLFCCAMSRNNETLWPWPTMTSPLVLSGPGWNELLQSKLPLCQKISWDSSATSAWMKVQAESGYGVRSWKTWAAIKICLSLLYRSHCHLYWRCSDCINKASLSLSLSFLV